jgi:hypothetical protein
MPIDKPLKQRIETLETASAEAAQLAVKHDSEITAALFHYDQLAAQVQSLQRLVRALGKRVDAVEARLP